MTAAESRASERVPQILFGAVLALLVLMATWWFWFLAHSVRHEDESWHRTIALQARVAALESAASPPAPGPLPGDPRLEVAPAAGLGHAIPGTSLEVRVTAAATAEHAGAMHRRKAMIYGEGAFLLLLVLGCVVMLFRLVLAERRYRRDIESFMSRVTHEMKTPLAGLKALLQTLRAGRIPEERLRQIAEMGLRQAEREEHLIENLLLAHRMRTRHEPLVVADVPLGPLLRTFVEHRVASMGASEGALLVHCEPGLAARAHAGSLTTILENLADNAFKYGARQVTLHGRLEGQGVVLTVSDDGDGFDPAHAEHLFTPFQREASASVGRHGTGLGLPIARTLAREMGGELRASSEGPGRGARFDILLPAPRPAPAPEAGVPAAEIRP